LTERAQGATLSVGIEYGAQALPAVFQHNGLCHRCAAGGITMALDGSLQRALPACARGRARYTTVAMQLP